MPSLYGAECMGGMWSSLLLLLEPDFCSQFFRSGSWVWGGVVFLYHVVQNLLQLQPARSYT